MIRLSDKDGKVELVIDSDLARIMSSLICIARPSGEAEIRVGDTTYRVVVLGKSASVGQVHQPVSEE